MLWPVGVAGESSWLQGVLGMATWRQRTSWVHTDPRQRPEGQVVTCSCPSHLLIWPQAPTLPGQVLPCPCPPLGGAKCPPTAGKLPRKLGWEWGQHLHSGPIPLLEPQSSPEEFCFLTNILPELHKG